jgi:Zn finger protein HypA/HybF involved in hydrogenase expression
MAGRYGGDQLSLVLLAVSIILSLIGRGTSLTLLTVLSYVPLGAALYRMFSKDIEKRRLENYKFAILISPIYGRFHKLSSRFQAARTHRHFKCPNCQATLRVPKGKSKIMVTCPKCGNKFEKRT